MPEDTKPYWTTDKQTRHSMMCTVSFALCKIRADLEQAQEALKKLMQENADGD